jgi:hypothetical protein
VRISVGLEDFEDLKEDMKMAFRKLLAVSDSLSPSDGKY